MNERALIVQDFGEVSDENSKGDRTLLVGADHDGEP
jgi:hypothetical protein